MTDTVMDLEEPKRKRERLSTTWIRKIQNNELHTYVTKKRLEWFSRSRLIKKA